MWKIINIFIMKILTHKYLKGTNTTCTQVKFKLKFYICLMGFFKPSVYKNHKNVFCVFPEVGSPWNWSNARTIHNHKAWYQQQKPFQRHFLKVTFKVFPTLQIYQMHQNIIFSKQNGIHQVFNLLSHILFWNRHVDRTASSINPIDFECFCNESTLQHIGLSHLKTHILTLGEEKLLFLCTPPPLKAPWARVKH